MENTIIKLFTISDKVYSMTGRRAFFNTRYQTIATLASGDSDRLCHFGQADVVATATARPRDL